MKRQAKPGSKTTNIRRRGEKIGRKDNCKLKSNSAGGSNRGIYLITTPGANKKIGSFDRTTTTTPDGSSTGGGNKRMNAPTAQGVIEKTKCRSRAICKSHHIRDQL